MPEGSPVVPGEGPDAPAETGGGGRMSRFLFIVWVLSFAVAGAGAAPSNGKRARASLVAPEFQATGTQRVSTQNFGPHRQKPVFEGEFPVSLVCITFPDCVTPESTEEVVKSLSSIRGSTIDVYYKEYSQGITWPTLSARGPFYEAPQPYGYYCRWNQFGNQIGWGNDGEGSERADKLRKDALEAVARRGGSHVNAKAVVCYVYCNAVDKQKAEKLLRPKFPKPPEGTPDWVAGYNPPLPWRDPLWPNSIPQVTYPADGGAIVHELGHVLGAPDFYHATEKYDGLPGTPCLSWAYGPTGMAYCRAIYQAFVPIAAYPTLTKPGTYKLAPRATQLGSASPRDGEKNAKGAPPPALGCFIPSIHPNYLFCVEFVQDEKPPVGTPGAEGLLIHVINVTFSSPMQGPPDLCYTYRPGDPMFRAEGNASDSAYFHDGDKFTMETDPKALLPNQLPAGLEITDIKIGKGEASFSLKFTDAKFTPKELADSLLPKVALTKVSEPLPTSFRVYGDMIYRGEPLNTEYGFCYGTAPKPTILQKAFPLYHRDRFDARLLDLRPGTTYYVRAYAKNANGVTYSERGGTVTTPKAEDVKSVPPLLTDHITGNFFINRWYFGVSDDVFNTANPLQGLMALAAYYRAMPGEKDRSRDAIDLARIHMNPSESRPDFRLKDVEALRHRMESLSRAAHLFHAKTFDKQWERAFVEALKIKQPKKCIFEVKDSGALEKYAAQIKEWLVASRPVMVIRENVVIPPETGYVYPLDMVLIDGFDTDGNFHMVFPCGRDRGTKRGAGFYPLADAVEYTTTARLVFYSPAPLPGIGM